MTRVLTGSLSTTALALLPALAHADVAIEREIMSDSARFVGLGAGACCCLLAVVIVVVGVVVVGRGRQA